jgi:hypothetical protein
MMLIRLIFGVLCAVLIPLGLLKLVIWFSDSQNDKSE